MMDILLCDIFTLCGRKSSAASHHSRHKITCVYYVTSGFGRFDLSNCDFYYVTKVLETLICRVIRGFLLRHKNYWTL